MSQLSVFAFKRESKMLEVKNLKFISFPLIRRPRFLSLSQTSILFFVRMSKQQILVPKLDEIMAGIRDEIEETMAEIFEKVPEKELQKEMGKEEVEVWKERKRKRGEEEN